MSSLVQVTGPALDPVTLSEARLQCRLTGNDEDAGVVTALLAARQHVENYIGRTLIQKTFDLSLDHGWPLINGERRIVLPVPPLISVTSVKYIDTNGTQQTLAANQYQVTLGDIFGEIVEAYSITWPSVRDMRDAIVVRFVTGYGSNPGDIPEPIRMAILQLTAHFYENREATVLGSTVAELPISVPALLSTYRTSIL